MNRYIYFYVLIIRGWVLVQWLVPSTKIDRLRVESTISKQVGGKATSHNLSQILKSGSFMHWAWHLCTRNLYGSLSLSQATHVVAFC